MIQVIVGDDEQLDSALKRFKKQVEREGLLKEFRRREYFEKPSALEHQHIREIVHKRKRKLMKVKSRRPNYGRNEKEKPFENRERRD
jgi:small subunit ribosomal protein S21